MENRLALALYNADLGKRISQNESDTEGISYYSGKCAGIRQTLLECFGDKVLGEINELVAELRLKEK